MILTQPFGFGRARRKIIMELSRILEIGRIMFNQIMALGFGDEVAKRFLDSIGLQKEAAMRLIEAASRADDSFVVFAKAVEYNLSPVELAGINRHLLKLCDAEAVDSMLRISHSLKEDVPVVFFRKDDRFDDDDLNHDYFNRCLVSDPYAFLAICRERPDIVSQRECMAHWQNCDNSKWYFAGSTPDTENNPSCKEGCRLSIYRGLDWYENRWCAGVPLSWIREYCSSSSVF